MQTSKAFQWYVQHSEEVCKYAGKHIAIIDDRIAASADSAKEAFEIAKKKYPDKQPALAYVPEEDVLIL